MSINRRVKRQQERDRAKMITKIHRETMERFKGMSEEQIRRELEEFQKQRTSGVRIIQPLKVDNLYENNNQSN
jgi:hypothetical protein